MKLKDYITGMRMSLPVFVGYFSVSFGFGALAVTKGLSALEATLISLTNLTSAGEFAGLSVIAASAPLIDMFITQLVINSRYALMSLALSQKMGEKIGLLPRFFIAFHNTDEIFAIAMDYEKPLTVPFMMGLGILPLIGWTGGTFFGAVAGTLLPESVRVALSVALYGMFVAIIFPKVKKSKPTLVSVLISAALACAFKWVPYINKLSEGMAIVVCAVVASAVAAILFPVEEREEAAE
ncbi:MAG: AzlC family ABC transporter permease [Clostridia bacterium]|nr:AzlC family ABC transporter permease [Clostridia bacterium]